MEVLASRQGAPRLLHSNATGVQSDGALLRCDIMSKVLPATICHARQSKACALWQFRGCSRPVQGACLCAEFGWMWSPERKPILPDNVDSLAASLCGRTPTAGGHAVGGRPVPAHAGVWQWWVLRVAAWLQPPATLRQHVAATCTLLPCCNVLEGCPFPASLMAAAATEQPACPQSS